ncbi:MAG: hybrid sensor histidine kinase/response regulator [Anaerolineae bacterium]|nr:hybrid sensor histidine kinase/response regulator [Anaerolineae bacterium]
MTKVLLAEDHLTLLSDIALELSLRGYEVVQATNGQVALQILQTSAQLPDIIVSDIAMPDMDGFELLEHLRGSPTWNAIPFLFLTAFDSPNSVRISKELGADDYIVKPFQADDLVLAMESKLKRIKAFQERAEQSLDETRQSLLHMISHELRSPLTTIYGGAEMLTDLLTDMPDETVLTLVNLIKNGADRMNRFSNKALALIQIDSGHAKKFYQETQRQYDIHKIAQTALDQIQSEMMVDDRNVELVYHPHGEAIYVQGVFAYLLTMIEEPLRNAVAFSKDGQIVELDIQIDDDRQAIITIQDHGLGISEAALPGVWDRFAQVDREQYEQQGAGLGLALVQESVHLHGGKCTIESRANTGTTVILSLPSVTTP